MSYKSDIEFIINNIYFDLDFNDIIATKEKFNYLVDNLQKDNFISEKTAQNIYLGMDKLFKRAYIICGSYYINLNKVFNNRRIKQ